ncbi:MAG: hypothetical protein Q8K14_16480, partial [Hydrogenophaga sp.]|uniref:hypothetical protein n=1 Tax=Hydrogenophaga sp. TaxID=1904254 RepID=UPI0027313BDD
QLLRQIQHVIRKGRVLAIERGALVLEQGREALHENTLFINCTASAVEMRDVEPIFQPGKILPQLVRAPLVTFSSAVCAYVEAHYDDDATRNALCTPVPFPRNVGGYVQSTLVSLANQMRWSQDKPLRNWMRESRLDGFGKMTASIDPADTEKTAIVAELRQQAMAAVGNVKRLMAGS